MTTAAATTGLSAERALTLLYTFLQREGRFSYTDEMACQNQIEALLEEKNVQYTREHRLDGGAGICDFYFPRSGLVMEVKAGKMWSKRSVYRQCERYCQHPDVKGLLLATGRIQGMPRSIEGKPVRIYQLGLGFL